MPSKLTTGEIIGTVFGILSVITPLAIFFIKHIIQARHRRFADTPGTVESQIPEETVSHPVPSGGNTFHIQEAHLNFLPDLRHHPGIALLPLNINHREVVDENTIGGHVTELNRCLSGVATPRADRVDTTDDGPSHLNFQSIPDSSQAPHDKHSSSASSPMNAKNSLSEEVSK